MQRVGNIALAVFAVLVLVGVIVVVGRDGTSTPAAAPSTHHPRTTAPASPTGSGGAPSTGTPSTSAGPGRTVIAFVGDDWTLGTGASKPAKRFTTLVSAELGATEVNLGVAGTGYAKTSPPDGDYASRVAQVVAAEPTMVVITGGRNDVDLAPGTVSADATKLIDALTTQLPKAKIVVVAPFWGDSDHPSTLDTVGSKVRSAAQSAGATYLDLPDPIHNHPSYMADDADPDDAGYAAIADALAPLLRTALQP